MDSPEAALEVLSEGVSFYIYGTPMPSVMVMKVCRVFAGHVSKHDGHVPQWMVATF